MIEHGRSPTGVERLALNAATRLAAETAGPASVLYEFDSDASVLGMSAILDGVLPAKLSESPLWAIVQRVGASGLRIRLGGPDVVFTFDVEGSERTLVSVEPSPYRRRPTTVDVQRAIAVSDAVFRAGGMLRLNESTGKWTTFPAEPGDTTPIARAFGGICYPACKLKEYSAVCLTEDGVALIEVGRPDHVFAFTRQGPDADIGWHRVMLRAKRRRREAR